MKFFACHSRHALNMEYATFLLIPNCLVIGNYIPEKRKFPGILCFRQQRSRCVRRVTILLSAR